jgi:hypothetical protein
LERFGSIILVQSREEEQIVNQSMASLKNEQAKPKAPNHPSARTLFDSLDLPFFHRFFGHVQAFNLADLLIVNVVGNTFETIRALPKCQLRPLSATSQATDREPVRAFLP